MYLCMHFALIVHLLIEFHNNNYLKQPEQFCWIRANIHTNNNSTYIDGEFICAQRAHKTVDSEVPINWQIHNK